MASVNGVEAFALKISLNNGDEILSFIDAKTFLEIKAIRKAVSHGKTVEVETLFGDFRAVNGVTMPFSLEIRPKGHPQTLKVILEAVEANAPLPDARFQMPSKGTGN